MGMPARRACGVQKIEPSQVDLSQVVMAVGLNPPAQKFTTNERGEFACGELYRSDRVAIEDAQEITS